MECSVTEDGLDGDLFVVLASERRWLVDVSVADDIFAVGLGPGVSGRMRIGHSFACPEKQQFLRTCR